MRPDVGVADAVAPPLPVPVVPRSRGSIWLAVAGALVAGILIGFASGYEAGRRTDLGAAGRTFTEDTVSEPVRVDPEPVVAAPEPAPAAPEPQPQPAAAPAARDIRRMPSVERTASGPGSLHVLSRPAGAQVRIDGRAIGRTPLVVPDVSAGAHDVRLELPGFKGWATSIDVSPGQRTRVAASLEQ